MGPYFVDWTDYRQHFEREASSYIGRPVTIGGKANVRLLPTPVMSFTDVRIGDPANPDVEMEHFRAEIELAALLKGEVRVIHMTVERPRFRFDLAPFATGDATPLGEWRVDPQRISLSRLEITDGIAEVNDSRAGRHWQAESISGTVEAASLHGPGSIEAEMVVDGTPVSLDLGLGRLSQGNLPLNVTLTSPDHPARLGLDGALVFGTGAPPRYTGTFALTGPASEDGNEDPRTTWTDLAVQGSLDLTPDVLGVEDVKISYGALQRPLILEASGRLGLAASPRFELAVKARQIDLDGALGGGPQAPVAVEAALEQLVAAAATVPAAAIPGTVRLDAQGVAVGGSVVQAFTAELSAEAETWQVETLSAVLPGETQFDLRGTLRGGVEPAFAGHGRVSSGRPAAFAAWWRGQAGSAGAIGPFAIETDFDLKAEQQSFAGLTVSTPEGTVSGSVDLRRFENSGELFAVVNLSADRTDLVKARALAELLGGKLLASGLVDQTTVSLRADVLSAGGIEARDVILDGGVEDGRVVLRRLAVADLAGANIDLSGTIENPFLKPGVTLEGSVDAQDLTGAAEFMSQVLPENSWATRFREIAPALSPVRADVSATIGVDRSPISISLTGSFANTHVTVSAAGQGALLDPASLNGTVRVHVEGEDSASVLAQLGFAAIPVRVGPLMLDAELQGALASSGRLSLTGSVAGIDLSYAAQTSVHEGRIALDGDLTATGPDIDPALLLAGIAVPGIGEGHPAAVKGRLRYGDGRLALTLTEASFREQPVSGSVEAKLGETIEISGSLAVQEASLPVLAGLALGPVPGLEEGRWSEQPFAAPLPANIAATVELAAETLDLGFPEQATRAALRLDYAKDAFSLDLAQAAFAGGTLKGSVRGSLAGGEADLVLRAGLLGSSVEALAWKRSGTPVASGSLDASVDATARGRTLAGLVSSLGGTGSVAVTDGGVNWVNPAALVAIMRLAQAEADPKEDEAREVFATQFSVGSLALQPAAASFSIIGGIVDFATLSIASEPAALLGKATLDLNTLSLASDWTIRAVEPGVAENQQPFVRLGFSGPIAGPERQVDLRPLLDLLQTRRMEHQLDRLQELEAEQRRAEATGSLPSADPGSAADLPADGNMPAGPGSVPAAELRPANPPAPDVFQQMRPAVKDILRGG